MSDFVNSGWGWFVAVATVVRFWRSASKSPKKNARFFMIGPPTVPPN